MDGSSALVHSFERDLLGICLALAPYEHSVLDADGRSRSPSQLAKARATRLLFYCSTMMAWRIDLGELP